MEEEWAAYYIKYIKDDLVGAEDDRVISDYLEMMIYDGDSWPDHFVEDADLFNKNPSEVFDSKNPIFVVVVKPRAEDCRKTDGCESGCWRIIGRDKVIKSQENNFLGFKRILKFYEKNKQRENKMSWVMEEYRVVKKWNQNTVICKIRVMFENEISFLLAKHFDSSSSLSAKRLLPVYGTRLLSNEMLPDYEISIQARDASYMQIMMTLAQGNSWPSYMVLNSNVYSVEPWTLVNLQDESLFETGTYFLVNKTESCGKTDNCDAGCWRIMDGDRLMKSGTGKHLGFKRIFKFCEKEKRNYACRGEQVKVMWTMEEYRLTKNMKQDKVLCVIKLLSSVPLKRLLQRY